MNLVRWSPLGLVPSRRAARMDQELDRLFDSFFNTDAARFAPPVDVVENAEEYVLRLDLPGVSQKDVKVELAGDSLTIRGERRDETHEKNGSVIRSERVHGTFERTFTLATPVQSDRVKATTKDGVLEIRIPKAEEARVREIPIASE